MSLCPGIRRTATGWEAYGREQGQWFSQRFPPDATTAKMQEWRGDERARIRLRLRVAELQAPPPGSFRADAVTYLATAKAMPTFQEREKHIREWVALFKNRPRSSISSAEIRAQLQAWQVAGLSASSINHRRSALMRLFRVLDADLEKPRPNPVAATPRIRPADPLPRGLPYATITRVLRKAQPYGLTVSYARLLVLAWTGLPPATLKRIQPEHVDRKAARVYVPGRLKGKGTLARYLPLTVEGARAFALLGKLKGWGPFDTSSLNRLWKRAAAKVPLQGTTLYDLRHSMGTALYAASGSIQATADLMGHADTRQTRRYALAAVDPRERAALRQFRTLTGASQLARKLAPRKTAR